MSLLLGSFQGLSSMELIIQTYALQALCLAHNTFCSPFKDIPHWLDAPGAPTEHSTW